MRLIDADALIKDLSDLKKSPWANDQDISADRRFGISEALDMIKSIVRCDQPTVDAVPVEMIRKRIDALKEVADAEFELNGGYVGSAFSMVCSLEGMLREWEERKDI